MKSVFVLAAFASLLTLAAAEPPACLLAAVGQQGMPNSIHKLCTDKQSALLGNLTSVCQGETLKPAYDVYTAVCSEVGVKINDLPVSSSTSSASATSTRASSSSSVPADATPTPSSATTTGDGPSETKPASAAAAIAPHALLFTLFGLSATGLLSVVFL